MKIIFSNNMPSEAGTPFGVYEYDEAAARRPDYVDIRGIVRKRSWAWLDDVQSSYESLSAAYLKHTRWWWLTPMSRLDLRPWWQEKLIKPLFFARAVVEWIGSNPGAGKLVLVGCDHMVAFYLAELGMSLETEEGKRPASGMFFVRNALKGSFVAVLKMLVSSYRLLRNHAFMPDTSVSFRTIVLYEYLPGLPLTGGHRYFYGTLFDALSGLEKDSIGYCCLEYSGSDLKNDRTEFVKDGSRFFLLDNISAADIVAGVLRNIHMIMLTWTVALKKIPCVINGSSSTLFWRVYLFHELGRVPFLNGICSYKALKTLLRRSGTCRMFVYPYEEKGIERALLYACAEHGVKTVGYTPHPQYRSALALRDTLLNPAPKPTNYAVCGTAYAEYFALWARKKRDSVSVWGSSKFMRRQGGLADQIKGAKTVVLLLLSHPNELRVFYSWLRADKRISDNVTYLVRYYKGANSRGFEELMETMKNEYGCLKESMGALEDDLKASGITAFCATSAGPQAVNMGHLAVYVDLNDFFDINPCFDDLDPMLPCANAAEFARRLDEIRKMEPQMIKELHSRQLSLVERIFSPVRTEAIMDTLGAGA